MTVDSLYRLIQFIVLKSQSGYVDPAQFNLIINQAQIGFFNYLIGEFQQYAPGRPIPRVQYGQNQTVRQRLAPVIYGYNLSIDGTGFSPYPGDYEQTDAMHSIYGAQRVRFVQQDQFYSVYGSKIDPYQSNPFYMIEDRGFRFFPQNYGGARLSYARNPPRIYWGYTVDGDGRPVYSPSSSEDPVWADSDCYEIVVRALAMVGVSLQSPQVSQYAQQIKEGGQ